MKKYLLDTNICIYSLKNNNQNIVKNFILHEDDDIYISIFTIAELLLGLEKGKFSKTQINNTKEFISKFEVVYFGVKEAEIYAKIRANLEQNGCSIGAMDTLIASVAFANNLTIVTNNEKEFQRVPDLKIENWAK